MPAVPRPESLKLPASPEEAAAIVAALERFMRATAPAPSPPSTAPPDPWRAAAILESVSRDPWDEMPSPAFGNPWINT
jgi:hypothetical protein